MKKFYLFTKTLLVAALLCVGQNAWADTTIGATTQNWLTGGSYSGCSTLSNNQTLTYTFKVDASKNEGDYQGYVLVVQEANTIHDINANTYAFVRSECDYYSKGSWNVGAIRNSNTYGAGTKRSHFVGADVVMTITRQNTEMVVYTEITKNATTKTHYYYQDLGTTDDVYVFMAADYAQLTLSSTDITTTESITIGDDAEFVTSAAKTLSPNSVLNFQFKNTDAGGANWDTWGIELVFNDGSDQYFDMNAGDLNPWGSLFTDSKTHNITKSSNWPESGILDKLDGADVTLTVVRCGRVVTVTAVNTPTSGDPFSFTYTLEPKDDYTNFGTENIQVKLIARYCRVLKYSSISKVNAEVSKYGWSTFSSQYKLDFSGVAGLEAYAVTGHDGNVITKSDALGVVAANTGVLLKGTEGSTSTFYNIPVSTGAAYDGTNKLVAGTGASVSKEDNMTKYVLGVSAGDEAEFQKIDGTSATVAKGKAYLVFDGESLARSMSLADDLLTGISEAAAATEAVVKEGKFFENGKLIIFKKGMKFNANGQVIK